MTWISPNHLVNVFASAHESTRPHVDHVGTPRAHHPAAASRREQLAVESGNLAKLLADHQQPYQEEVERLKQAAASAQASLKHLC